MQEDKEPIFDSAVTLRDALQVTTGAVATLTVCEDRMRAAADDPMLLATDLAEVLVGEGVPFREAHEVVGKIVGHCVRENADLRTLGHDQMKQFHAAFPAGADELLDLERSLERRALAGGTARARVREALDAAEARADEELRGLERESRR
jgi:argininosuccinate lyase